ncbi:MAG: hypothetical protein RBS88_10085, partial [Spongiibacteraceae bacterium]|nr:hypothetical protein [Spongiibacteraceae bacterium]
QFTDLEFRIGYPDQLIFAPDNPKVVFMSGAQDAPFNWIERNSANGTVVISEDGGRNWRAPKNGFPEGRANVEAMAIYTNDQGFQLFAGTTDGDVFASSDRGETWERIIEGLSAVSKPTHDTLIAGVSYGTEPPAM